MANKIKQFRYYNDKEAGNASISRNYPYTANKAGFISGSVFEEENCFPVLQLGIQALPGTRVLLNKATDQNYIIIGQTGIFELDLDNQTEITSIQFDSESMANIENTTSAVLIVDIIYDDGEG